MRRSAHPRVRSEGEVLFEDASMRAQLVNLSRGGLCARGVLPKRVIDGVEARPDVLHVLLGLPTGAPPIAAEARLAWVRDPDGDDPTFGLSFVDVGPNDRARLDAVIAAQLGDAPLPSENMAVRLKLASGPVLRAIAESIDSEGAVLGAELPWLRVGGSLEAEVDGRWLDARPTWIGLEVDEQGTPRLRIRVAFSPQPQRRDDTLPYFFSAGDTPASVVRAEIDAIVEGEEEEWARERMVAANAEPPRMALTSTAQLRAQAFVRKAFARRAWLAVGRVLVAVLLALLGAFAWRAWQQHNAAPKPVDVPADVHPVTAAPTPIEARPLIENARDPAPEEPAPTVAPSAGNPSAAPRTGTSGAAISRTRKLRRGR